jgi:hypothetical protein
MHTFTTLEPGHPLRSLAINEANHSSYGGNSEQTIDAPLQYENNSQEEDRFSFEVQPHAPLAEVASERGTPERGAIQSPGSLTYEPCAEPHQPYSIPGPFAYKTVHFVSPFREASVTQSFDLQAHTPVDSEDRNAPVSASQFVSPVFNPFATPGPASHFKLPSDAEVQASPLNLVLENYSADHQDRSSDSITLADAEQTNFSHFDVDSKASAYVSIGENNELDVASAVKLCLFSTPGPVFTKSRSSPHASGRPPQSMQFFDSPTADPLLPEPEDEPGEGAPSEFFDESKFLLDYEAESHAPLPCGHQGEDVFRFIVQEQDDMSRDIEAAHPRQDDRINSDAISSTTAGDVGQQHTAPAAALNYRDDFFNQPCPTGNEVNAPQEGLDSPAPLPIEVFSSPPFIRFIDPQPQTQSKVQTPHAASGFTTPGFHRRVNDRMVSSHPLPTSDPTPTTPVRLEELPARPAATTSELPRTPTQPSTFRIHHSASQYEPDINSDSAKGPRPSNANPYQVQKVPQPQVQVQLTQPFQGQYRSPTIGVHENMNVNDSPLAEEEPLPHQLAAEGPIEAISEHPKLPKRGRSRPAFAPAPGIYIPPLGPDTEDEAETDLPVSPSHSDVKIPFHF